MGKLSNKGFTIAEMLAVIVILSILAAIAVVSVSSIRASLRIAKLDSAAEEIFLSSQRDLSFAKLYSESSVFGLENINYIVIDENSSEKYDAIFDTERMTELFGVKSAVIEFDSVSCDILYVAVSDRLSAEEIEEAYFSLSEKTPQAAHMIGLGLYGNSERGLAPRKYSLEPIITVNNGEELDLEIACEGASVNSVFTVDISSDYGSVSRTVTPEYFVDGFAYAHLTVDKMTETGGSYYIDSFSESLGVPKMLTVTAKVESDGETTSPAGIMQSKVAFSPLFGDGSLPEIACIRHFNNIRFSDPEQSFIQVADIDFDGVDFKAIPTFDGDYLGMGHELRNLKLEAFGEKAGIFEDVSGSIGNIKVIAPKLYCAENTKSAGIICAELLPDGLLSECEISDAYIYAESDGLTVGSAAGTSRGEIVSCDISAKFKINSDNVSLGGVAGQAGGHIKRCRVSGSAGFLCSGAGSHIAGISPSGSGVAELCYSSFSPEYIGGADFSAIGLLENDCVFLSENAWLCDCDGGLEYSEVEEVLSNGSEISEVIKTVSLSDLSDPRGLAGIVKVTYSEDFTAKALASFDGFGNNSPLCPVPTWSDPSEGEERYYFFSSISVSPGPLLEFDPGSHCTIGDEFAVGNYFCREIFSFYTGETAVVSINSERREVKSETSEPIEILSEGIVGVAVTFYNEFADFDIFSFTYSGVPAAFYTFYETDTLKIEHNSADLEMPDFFPQIDYPPYSVRVYGFISEEIQNSFSLDADFAEGELSKTAVDGVVFYELYNSPIPLSDKSEIVFRSDSGDFRFEIIPEYDDLFAMFIYDIESEQNYK